MTRKIGTIDDFCEHLQRIGMAGRVFGKIYGEDAIKLTGRNIGMIRLNEYTKFNDSGYDLLGKKRITISYIVSPHHVEPEGYWEKIRDDHLRRLTILSKNKEELKRQGKKLERAIDELTTLTKKKQGLLRKKATGSVWVGHNRKKNRISEILNRDIQLNNYLTLRFQEGMPDISITLSNPIEKLYDIVTDFESDKLYLCTTREDIEAFDTIAKHIKEV